MAFKQPGLLINRVGNPQKQNMGVQIFLMSFSDELDMWMLFSVAS